MALSSLGGAFVPVFGTIVIVGAGVLAIYLNSKVESVADRMEDIGCH